MSARRGTCVLYSEGHHFPLALRKAGARWPGEPVTAVAPPAWEREGADLGADAVEVTEQSHYSPWNVAACARLLRQIRRGRHRRMVVLFPSTQLRVLAALSGAPERYACLPNGHMEPLRGSAAGVIARVLARALWGRLVYGALWVLVRVTPVRDRGAAGERNR